MELKEIEIENDRQDREASYASLLAVAPVGIFRNDIRGQCTFVNAWCEEISGLNQELLLKDGWIKILHPEDREGVIREWERCRRKGRDFRREYRILHKDGTIIWVYGQIVAERNHSGEIIGYVGTLTNISARIRIEKQLENLIEGSSTTTGKDFFPAVVPHIASALDVDHVLIGSKRADQLEVVAFWSAYGIDPPPSLPFANAPCGKSLREGEYYQETGVQEQFPQATLLGQIKADSYLGIAIKDTQGEVIGNICILDRTPIREHQKARKLLRAFGARVAAELERDRARRELEQINKNLERKIEERTRSLKASEERLQLVLRGANDGFWDWDLLTGHIFVSERWKSMRGLDRETSYNPWEIWTKYVHPDDIYPLMAAINDHLTGKTEFLEIEYRIRHRDGHYIWIFDRGQALRDESGRPVRMSGSGTDISALKSAEERLANLSDRLNLALQAGAIGIWDWDFKGELIWDERIREIYGLQEIDRPLTYEDWRNRVHPEDRSRTEKLFWEAVRGQREYNLEFRVCRTDGEVRWVKALALIGRDWKGEAVRITGINYDMTQAKENELNLARYAKEVEDLYDKAPCGYHSLDPEGRYIRVNQTELQWLGYSREEVIGRPFSEFITPATREAFARDYPLFKSIGRMKNLEYELLSKDGSIVPVILNASAVNDEEGNYLYSRATMSDIRERIQAEGVIRQQIKRETLLREITQKIRQSLELPTIFDTACEEIRGVLKADRVCIFQFDSGEGAGQFVAESVAKDFTSVFAVVVKDEYFENGYLYAQGQFSAVDDIYDDGIEIGYIDILTRLQVRANLVMPLLCEKKLWGLLWVHQCAGPRHWEQMEIDFTHQLANQLAIAIQQAHLYNKIQTELRVRQEAEAKIALQLRQKQTLGAIVRQIRESLNIEEILTTVTREVRDVLQGDRVLVFRLFADGRSKIVEEDVAGEFTRLKDLHWENEVWDREILELYWRGQPRIVPDVMHDRWTDCLVEYSRLGQIRSKIVAPILQDGNFNDGHRWICSDKNHRLWGILVIHSCKERRIWQESEAQLLQQIANQLAIAIQQATLFERLQEELRERQQAQQELILRNAELARATRLKDEFLANMSHELRTPLNAILGMSEALREAVFSPLTAEQNRALETVERSGFHLLELINDILDLAKIEAGQLELERVSTDIENLCRSSLAFIKQQAFKKNIAVELFITEPLPYLLLDERRIRQVLLNLLNNAVKFTHPGGKITLRVEIVKESSGKKYLTIAVIDTGIGIASKYLDRLFQPFVQIDSALNRQYAGTGLGLALVKRIVELHGGQVTVNSEVTRGSCFTVHLPVLIESNSTRIVEPDNIITTVEETSEKNISSTILLAEDNEANILTVSSYLRARGYKVLVAKNGEEAVTMTESTKPNLILMDIQMPGMDGLEAIRRIRLNFSAIQLPIIAFTALAMPEDRDNCLEAGANDYLSKPVKLKELVVRIKSLLSP